MASACGKPFGTRSTIEAVVQKMTGHSMFADEDALNRLRMCADCRVIAQTESDLDPHAGPGLPKPKRDAALAQGVVGGVEIPADQGAGPAPSPGAILQGRGAQHGAGLLGRQQQFQFDLAHGKSSMTNP